MKLFIGGLSPHTTKESLQRHFSKYGEIADCILMIDRVTGRSRCFGFVLFAETGVIDKVLAHEQVVDGKKVDCKPAVPTRPALATPEPTSSVYTKKLFVGGLPPDVTEETFRQYFEPFGRIEDSIVMFDRNTGRPRGFGFITFINEESVDKVLANYESNFISGKWVECKKATPKQVDSLRSSNNFMNPYMVYPPSFMPQPVYYNMPQPYPLFQQHPNYFPPHMEGELHPGLPSGYPPSGLPSGLSSGLPGGVPSSLHTALQPALQPASSPLQPALHSLSMQPAHTSLHSSLRCSMQTNLPSSAGVPPAEALAEVAVPPLGEPNFFDELLREDFREAPEVVHDETRGKTFD